MLYNSTLNKNMIYKNILDKVGKTPLVQIKSKDLKNINLFAKIESFNPTGSTKDRAASYLIEKLLKIKEINSETTLIESSSGNFGLSLSAYSKKHGLKFYCVVDSKVLLLNETLIRKFGTTIIKVTEPDSSGNYLSSRIKKVKKLVKTIPNSYWINQYANKYNAEAYHHTLGNELCNELDKIDYIFMAVSSGGTITGVSQKIKEVFPKVKVIAVDIEGSVIFGGLSKKRHIYGMGSSIVPKILKKAEIDDIVVMDEISTVKMCHELLEYHSIFAGGSSGTIFAAIKKYFAEKKIDKKPNVVMVFPDGGDRYINTIYNQEWYNNFISKFKK
jgi:cysteine synthase A